MILLQSAILLLCIFVGARLSGIGLGVMGMLGLLVFLFGFGMAPADPPLEVMLIILSVVTSAAALQGAGGMDLLVQWAAALLRRKPEHITLLGPIVTYLFTLFAGTAHISYSILPIISEIAIRKRIRPERALSMSVTAAHMGITASPVSAASAALLTVLAAKGVSLGDILLVCIPSTFFGVLVGVLFVWKRGAELANDPEFLERLQDPTFQAALEGSQSSEETQPGRNAVISVAVFALAVTLIVFLGSFPRFLPHFENAFPSFTIGSSGALQMPSLIMMVMLASTGVTMLLTGTPSSAITKTSLFASAAQATIAVFGVVWMSATFMAHNEQFIQNLLSDAVTSTPWLFALALFALSTLLFSQAATTKALMPLGLGLGLAPHYLVGIFPAVNGHFFIPGYPTLLTAIQFDRTGSTRIGRYVLNHSFMLPGIVTTIASVLFGICLQSLLL